MISFEPTNSNRPNYFVNTTLNGGGELIILEGEFGDPQPLLQQLIRAKQESIVHYQVPDQL